MALATRGSNPIWYAPDLTANPMDDQYWFYVLQNTIPYNPATVWQDEDRQVIWSSPIQMLSNGTLPENIFYDPEATYRLEWRYNEGNLTPPSQSDALIYLVENYKPSGGGGGSTSSSLTSDNQMTNPQFSLVSFESPLSITSSGTYEIAPGWDLVLAGSGTATVTQESLNDDNTNPTNAPYSLRLTLVGWTSSGTYLRQRFNQNGMLWAEQFVSTSVTARVEAVNANISASLFDSNGTELAVVLESVQIDSNYTEYKGVTSTVLDASTNPDVPPNAYVEYRLNLPGSIDIYLTSLQVLASSAAIDYNYEQETIERQLDHTYHLARPIVPVGTVIDYFGFGAPEHYLRCDGTDTYSRVTYYELFNALTTTESVTLTTGNATFTVANAADYCIGMGLEGDGITSGSVITNIVGTTVTMNNVATATGANSVRFFLAGFGDSAATFAVPDLRNQVVAGVGGSLFGTASNGLGAQGGKASHQITANELPAHTHQAQEAAASGVGAANRLTSNATGTGASTGVNVTTHTALSLVQETALARKLIRFE